MWTRVRAPYLPTALRPREGADRTLHHFCVSPLSSPSVTDPAVMKVSCRNDSTIETTDPKGRKLSSSGMSCWEWEEQRPAKVVTLRDSIEV